MGLKLKPLGFALALTILTSGCVSNSPEIRRTQVVTFPEDAIVFYNNEELGRAPAMITLPQDEHGRLVARAVVRALPRDDQPYLEPATRIFEPMRQGRVPDRIMLDLTGYHGTNFVVEMEENPVAPPPPRKPKYTYTPRSKPTQVLGID